MIRMTFILALSVAFISCNGGNGNDDGGNGSDGSNTNCPDISGNWQLGFSCTGAMGGSEGGAPVEVTQTECEITLIQHDDNTTEVWTSTGSIDQDGNISLTGNFGFTDAETCGGLVTGNSWTGACTTADWDCEFEAERF